MVELDAITIEGFKSIASITKLELKAINVLIGANGSGKSNFIEVFSFLNAIREGHLQEYVGRIGGADRILFFGSKETDSISIKISFMGGVNQYEISLRPTEDDELIPIMEKAYFWEKKTHPKPYSHSLTRIGKEAGISAIDARRIPGYVKDHLGSWRLYHFHDTSSASPMKRTQDINDNRFLRPDGSNLASYLYYLREKYAASYKLIRSVVQNVAPFFDDFILEPQKLNPEKILLEWRNKGSDAYFSASSLSDGTLRFVTLATLFLQPDSYLPKVILLDEPELGLHPYAVTMLASLIKQVSIKSQVIAATQSTLLLDHFQPEDVLVADLVDRGTQIKRLENENLEIWLQDYSLGQLWEKNQFGGRPTEG